MAMLSARDVAAVLRSRLHPSTGKTRIHKMLYYCQAWHLVWEGERIFPEEIQAWEDGPVVAGLWRHERWRDTKKQPVRVPTRAEDRVINYVLRRYGPPIHTRQLVGKTHKEAPWSDAWAQGKSTPIRPEALVAYYSQDPAAEQAWFWDPEWQAGEHEADRDIRDGRAEVYTTDRAFLDSLSAHRADV